MKRLIVAALLALSLAAPVSAHAAANSITLNQTDPHLGGPATFTIVMPSKYDCSAGRCKSHVEVDCSQNGLVVWSWLLGSDVAQTSGFLLDYDPADPLHPNGSWAIGVPASCVATLTAVDHSTTLVLASTTFTAAG